MTDLTHFIVAMVAISPLLFILSIWSIEYMLKMLMLAGGWILGTIGLWMMGRT